MKHRQDLIALFVEIGADLAATNKQGLGVMHIAAQGDQPLSLAFLKYQYDVEYLHLDDKNSTALHWAAYLGSDQAAALLLAWDQDHQLLNEQDADGHTALHLAAISGNVKIVRTLLLHGADSKRSVRSTQDKKGRTPLDIARESKVENIAAMLEDSRLLTACGMKPALRAQQKSWGNVLAFVVLLSAAHCYSYICLLPTGCKPPMLVLIALLYTLIVVLVCRDPGGPSHFPTSYLSPDKSLLHLYLTNESHKVCPECVVVQPKRARHCTICRMCVFKYDHHCPWINNCIGARNICVFYCFLVLLWLDLALILAGIVLGWVFGFHGPHDIAEESVWKGLSLVVASAVAGFLGPLSLLLWVQTRNLSLNRTTHERFAYTNREKSDSFSSQTGENSGCCLSNCASLCCDYAISVDVRVGRSMDRLDRPLLGSTMTS